MIVEYTRVFDRQFKGLSPSLQVKAEKVIAMFLDCYAKRQYPAGLRVHRVGFFLSLSLSMNYRILVLPISQGVQFAFVGTHEDVDRYLRHA